MAAPTIGMTTRPAGRNGTPAIRPATAPIIALVLAMGLLTILPTLDPITAPPRVSAAMRSERDGSNPAESRVCASPASACAAESLICAVNCGSRKSGRGVTTEPIRIVPSGALIGATGGAGWARSGICSASGFTMAGAVRSGTARVLFAALRFDEKVPAAGTVASAVVAFGSASAIGAANGGTAGSVAALGWNCHGLACATARATASAAFDTPAATVPASGSIPVAGAAPESVVGAAAPATPVCHSATVSGNAPMTSEEPTRRHHCPDAAECCPAMKTSSRISID
ncbi:hypothetical protein C5E45_10795 [Nocardia nova]|uniref:Uncharacterized protein n=1 Tax=Nocardia nova TaxID=37330 RepID=A0A2S6ASN9_9NOCA|nr:hypothetical protein C5E41_09745 [Nocardia nova]PPJ38234.1 hypothetical protein C5E45_10795 [Nocardia nova]